MINHEFSISVGNEQDIGMRREQEDYFATMGLESIKTHGGFLAIVADGMGGHADGGNASIIAVDEFMDEYKKKTPTESIPEALYRALFHANKAIADLNRKDNSNRGTTLVACVVQGKRLYWVSVGDSYLFHYRNGELCPINKLHTVGAELSNGRYLIEGPTQIDARKRNMLTSYLGLDEIPEVDPSKKYFDWKSLDLKLGDKLLLCSDGLVNTLNRDEISQCLQNPQEAQQICEQLISGAKAKNRREQDNITVILLEMKPGIEDTNQPYVAKARKKNIVQKYWLPATLVLLAVLTVIGVAFAIKPNYFSGLLDFRQPVKQEQAPVSIQDITPSETTLQPCPPIDQKVKDNEKGKSCVIECFSDFNRLKVQKILTVEKLYKGKVDGKWGAETENAVREFQKNNAGIEVNGKLDQKTCQKLMDIYREQKTQIESIRSDLRDETHIKW